ncbi:TetR/AcrR family transcriptional regulator [Actinomadura darangshiensis]|uniref:TetR/AcrR family transcriptional regulator n=1 Tax=Actinomadura darangshiensis TaxID=705336 RepID=A0A4V2YWB6_9ACTN|nr:TetR/AcrR family transcriptional regulator [Actinomadura darangshiensis]TDD84777.1 TetR/AcrR family transcriptional regulator [Actinomadura darangshiensis]
MGNGGATAWLEEGLALLAEQGAPAVTLDRMCERMGMSKGAFYHHFGSMPKFRTRLLSHYEDRYTTAIIDVVEEAGDLPAREKLERLTAEAVNDTGPGLEIAVRAWAKQDPEAAAMQQRVDARRIEYLRGLCESAGHASPVQMATLLYLVLIGGAHLMPPLPAAGKHEIYELLLPLMDLGEDPS